MYLWRPAIAGGGAAALAENKEKGAKVLGTAGSALSVVLTFIRPAGD